MTTPARSQPRVNGNAGPRSRSRVRSLLTAGLSTSVIAGVLPCVSADGGFLAPTCPRTRAELTDECRRIGAAIEEPEQSRRLLEAVINGAGRDDRPAVTVPP